MKKIIILMTLILAFSSTKLMPQNNTQLDQFPYGPENDPEKKEINIALYKNEMIEGINADELYDMTELFYNEPKKTDLFLEAYFNNRDFPDMSRDISIKISESEYQEKKELYKKIREKKYLVSSTTVKFTQYAQIDEYPTGGLLYKKDYNMETATFRKSWKKEELWSKYRWRMIGEKRKSTMILMDGAISLEVTTNEAKALAGIRVFTRPQKTTFMALLKIKETGKDYILLEPVRYMIIWRKRGRVYSNFDAILETPRKIEEKKPEEKKKEEIKE